MNREYIYERRQSAARMETVALLASIVGIIVTVLVTLSYGWLAGACVLLVTFLCYAFSRLFDLVSEIFACLPASATQDRARSETRMPATAAPAPEH